MGFQVVFQGLIRLRFSVFIACAFALTACGGDGGDDAPSPTPPLLPKTYSGYVAKGVIVGGQVSVYAVDDGMLAVSPLAQTETDDSGGFSVTVESMPSPVYVELKGQGEASWMLCDLLDCGLAVHTDWDINGNGRVDYGEKLLLEDDFRLGAYVFDWSSSSSININLLTHLVAASFASPPTASELNGRQADMRDFLVLSQLPAELGPVAQNPIDAGGESLRDSLLVLGLLPPVSGRISSLAGRINELTQAFAASGSLAATPGISLTLITHNALLLAREMAPSQTEVISELETRNQSAAAEESQVPSRDRPIFPPLT